MKTATVTEFRARAKELLQEVEDDQDILILSRPKGQEGFVVLTMGHFESLEETAHLLSTPANAMRLMQGIAEAKAGNVAQSFEINDLMRLVPPPGQVAEPVPTNYKKDRIKRKRQQSKRKKK